MFSVDF